MDKLDAGISKRPSRFDRKYHFALPSTHERAQYVEHWRWVKSIHTMSFVYLIRSPAAQSHEYSPPSAADTKSVRAKLLKLQPNLALPTNFSAAIAKITDGFSFAYLQETFVSALLSLARSGSSPANTSTQNGPDSSIAAPSTPPPKVSSSDSLEANPVWQAIKSQVETLRREMKDSRKSVEDAERNSIASDPKTSSAGIAGFGLRR